MVGWFKRKSTAPGKTGSPLPYLGIRYSIGYDVCNLDCPYCIAEKHKNKKKRFDIETFKRVLAKIEALPYRVCLRIGSRGELFTSPAILEVITALCAGDNTISGVNFSSNIQADWDRVIKPFLDAADTRKLGMGCTLHDMVIDDIDGFFRKVGNIKESGVSVYVGYVAVPHLISRIPDYKKRCNHIGVPLILNPLLGPLEGAAGAEPGKRYPRDYTAEERRRLKEVWDTPHGYKMLVEACPPRGMDCSAGKNFIFIDDNGDVYPCKSTRKKMGNILTGKVKFKKKDTVCHKSRCFCGNQNQALRIVDDYYRRTRNLRVFFPMDEIGEEQLVRGYNPPAFGSGG